MSAGERRTTREGYVVEYAQLSGRTVVQHNGSKLVDMVVDGMGTAAEASDVESGGPAAAYGWTLGFYLYCIAVGAALGAAIRYGVPAGPTRVVLAAAAAVALLIVLRALTRMARDLRNGRQCHLTDAGARKAFETARAAAERIDELWPPQARVDRLERPSTVLSDSLWRLASTLDERQLVSAAVSHLIVLQVGLPERSVGRDWIRDRTTVLGRRLDELDTDVSQRVDRLVRLADACQQLSEHATALNAAKRSAESADPELTAAMTGVLLDAGVDTTAPLSEPTSEVLSAYRELATEWLDGEDGGDRTSRLPAFAPVDTRPIRLKDHNNCSSRARSTASRRRPVPSFR
jgi:hypothetical protein